MDRIPVTSTTFVSIGYDKAASVLEVEFAGGAVYQYADVPAEVHAALLDAPSLGAYFGAHIRNAYPFTRLS